MMLRWMFVVPPAIELPSEPMIWSSHFSGPRPRVPAGAGSISASSPRMSCAVRAMSWPISVSRSFIIKVILPAASPAIAFDMIR